jgi:2-polyprenyl-6-methoxyphenol hydroxylase-like FAD-dependent oxidoreductase
MRRFNILIVGGGVAGLLRLQGPDPTIIQKETAEKYNKSGYMLGLLLPGGRVLTDLDLDKRYSEESVEMKD